MTPIPEQPEPDMRPEARRRIRIANREFTLPQSRMLRISMGIVLIVLGIFGFLPVLGFWMIPLGLLILSYEFAYVRRRRRRFAVWWSRRQRGGRGSEEPPASPR